MTRKRHAHVAIAAIVPWLKKSAGSLLPEQARESAIALPMSAASHRFGTPHALAYAAHVLAHTGSLTSLAGSHSRKVAKHARKAARSRHVRLCDPRSGCRSPSTRANSLRRSARAGAASGKQM